MTRFLAWLWWPGERVTVVKAISWTEMLIDRRGGQREHVWIVEPGLWILGRFIELPREAYRGTHASYVSRNRV